MALAESGYQASIPVLRRLVDQPLEPMVLTAIGDALVRLGRAGNRGLLAIVHDGQAGSHQTGGGGGPKEEVPYLVSAVELILDGMTTVPFLKLPDM
jgi:hypothetical protein